jgi:hypothetical protein
VRVAFAPPVAVADLVAAEEPLLELIDRQVWPTVQREYGRLRAAPGVVAILLAAIGIRGLIGHGQSRKSTMPRVIGVVAPRKERRRKARRRLLERLGPRRRG